MSQKKNKGPKIDRFEKERLKKRDQIIELGRDPFGQRFDDAQKINAVRALCPEFIPAPEDADDKPEQPNGPDVKTAGRVMLRRKAGKLRFYDIEDASGPEAKSKVQLLFSRGDLSEEQWTLMGQVDLGDLIGVEGVVRRTNTGEVSIAVKELTILCKSMVNPPEKWHGIADDEVRLRNREQDLIYSDGVRKVLLQRSKIIDSVRQTLRERDFVEVETPVLHSVAGGAAARPFITHHNALDLELYQRIALELHLKRLMVGGIDRVYEIGRVFRNEGIDRTHNPEFTMTEIYQAYGNYRSMMDLTEAIIVDGIRAAGGPDASLTIPWGEHKVDFTPPFRRATYAELFAEHVGCEMTDEAAVLAKANAHGLETAGRETVVLIGELFEEFVEDHLEGPVFVIDYPAALCPLTKRKQDDPTIAERFELFVHGMELANAYTELNDPHLQEELFQTQLAGLDEEESMAKMDHEFIRALKVGMPPAGGLGIGIDRLVMLLTNSDSIRDVIYFPLLRPEGSGKKTKENTASDS